jgi:SAM-dependent methyltransferase
MQMTSPATHQAAAPDLAAVKKKQNQIWASGDYSAVASRIVPIAENLCDAADLRAGAEVLDVATGSGNAALAAARCGCVVTGVDYVPALLERGRTRAVAEDLDIQFLDGDAESLPFADASFDAVLSVVGVMFTPDQEKAAAELLRVCRPGGTIALANWTPDSFIGDMFRTVGRHIPPPAGVKAPSLWGTEERIKELLGHGTESLVTRRRTYTFRFRSPADFVDFFRTNYGPTLTSFATLDPAAQARLADDLISLIQRYDRLGGAPVAIPSEYLEVVAVRAER